MNKTAIIIPTRLGAQRLPNKPLKLINNKDTMIKPLAKSLANVYKKVIRCNDCGNLKIIDNECICKSKANFDKICVVENLADMWVIESANIFKGYFHSKLLTFPSQSGSAEPIHLLLIVSRATA